MTVHVIKAPAGLGKTSLMLKKIRALPEHTRVEIYVPTLTLAQELHAKLLADGQTAIVIRGRDQQLEEEQRMCRKWELASAIAHLGYAVFPVICMGPRFPGDRFSVKSCEHFSHCEYLAQFDSTARVHIYTHAYLPLPRNSRERTRPSHVVIDESFLQHCLLRHSIPRGRLDQLAQCDAAASCVIGTLLKAIDERKPILAAAREARLTPAVLAEVSEDLGSAANAFHPFDTDQQFLSHLEDVAPRMRADLLMQILATELGTQRSECHGITFDYSDQALLLHYRKPITRFRYAGGEPTILIIDANADAELLRPWFPSAEFTEVRAERKAFVVQCSSARGATTSFVPEKNTDGSSKERARRNLHGLQELTDSEADNGKKRVLVVGPQAITGNPAQKVPALLKCPPNGALAHFNGLRGGRRLQGLRYGDRRRAKPATHQGT